MAGVKTIHIKPALRALFMALLAAGPARAQWDGWDYTFDREVKPWAEMQAQIPPYPKDDTLIPLNVGAANSHRYFIDSKSVSAGSDGVVRYTMVVRTSGGATNVSFEGIRCDTREQKYYALGRSDGSWTRARNPQWRYIEFKQANNAHLVFYGEYACKGRMMVDSAAQILQALRHGTQREQFPN